jgi:hypothetical protein
MSIFFPVQSVVDWITYSVLPLEKGTKLADSVNFFIFDSIKIILLLIAINYLMAVINYYLPLEKIRDFLHSRKWYGLDYFFAATLGAVTPFCSCSSIPLFVGFLGIGIPFGVTITFLISSPLISEVAVVMMLGMFGFRVTAWYVAAGIIISMLGGLLLSKVDINKHISRDILEMSKRAKIVDTQKTKNKFDWKLLRFWWGEGFTLTKKLIPYVLIGIGIGAVMHGYIPQDFFAKSLGSGAWWTVPLATILAVPLYANAAGVIPVMQVLVAKGASVGAAMAFLMATIGLSLPEALILKKAMSLRLLLAFFGIVAVGIIIIGYTLNIVF